MADGVHGDGSTFHESRSEAVAALISSIMTTADASEHKVKHSFIPRSSPD